MLNELDVLVCDIHNAYLMEDFRERVWVVARPKFGSEARENMLTRKELYGLKISSTAFRDFLVQILYEMGYQTSYDDLDLWLRP